MNYFKLSARVIAIRISTLENQQLVANALLYDYQNPNPKRPVFKVSFWGSEAQRIADEQVKTKDELCLEGMVYAIDSNKNGYYIEMRNCKLLDIIKVTKTQVFHTEPTEKAEIQSKELPKEGDSDE